MIFPAHPGIAEDFPAQLMHITLPATASRRQGGKNHFKGLDQGRTINFQQISLGYFEIFFFRPVEGSHVNTQQSVQCDSVIPIPAVLFHLNLFLPVQVGGGRYMLTSEKLGKAKIAKKR